MLLHRRMEPIRDGQCSKINVVVGSGWSVDDDGSDNTVGILNRIMRMVPRSPVLGCFEPVHFGLAGGNGAFGQAVGAIHLVRTQLAQSWSSQQFAFNSKR